jgi:hypothetical protein
VLTDIATGWTECAPLLVREQKLPTEVLTELRKLVPMPLLGFDTDNDVNRSRPLPGRGYRLYALPSVSQERSGLGGAKERGRGAPDRGLSALRRP